MWTFLALATMLVGLTLGALETDQGHVTADPVATRLRAKDSLALSHLDRSGTLLRLAHSLDEQFAVRQPISIVVETCDPDFPPARWTPSETEIAICDDLIEITPDLDTLEAVVRFLSLHEFSHALADTADIYPTGGREDAADQFAAWMLIESDRAEDVLRAARFLFRDLHTDAEQDPSSEHSFDAQRYFNLLCWTAGARPDLTALAGGLPESRLGGCAEEFDQLDRAWWRTVRFNRIRARGALVVRWLLK